MDRASERLGEPVAPPAPTEAPAEPAAAFHTIPEVEGAQR